MTIKQVSEKYGVSQDTLRYYERGAKTGVLSWDEPEKCSGDGNG